MCMMPSDWVRTSLDLYLNEGYCPGGLLVALLSNDIYLAVMKIDSCSILELVDIVKYIIEHMPAEAYGCIEKVLTWQRHGGLQGLNS